MDDCALGFRAGKYFLANLFFQIETDNVLSGLPGDSIDLGQPFLDDVLDAIESWPEHHGSIV